MLHLDILPFKLTQNIITMIKSKLSPAIYIIIAHFTFIQCTSQNYENTAKIAPPPPNILFCIADDASHLFLKSYSGVEWVETPAFDRVAAEGILFSNAYTPNAKCAPSRSAILTGRNSWQLDEAANHWPVFPEKFGTFPEVLARNGYQVGYTGKGWAPGRAFDSLGNTRNLIGKNYSSIITEPPTTAISGIDYAANFKQFIDDNKKEAPWFFWYGGLEPHRAYEFESGLKAGKELASITNMPPFWPDTSIVRTDLLDYALEVEYFDAHLGKMINLLESTGQLENTLIIVTSDNGMPFPRIKGQEYELSNHLPLAVMWPKGIKNPGRLISDYISFIDFAPSFLELAGISKPVNGMQSITGKSFTDIFNVENEGQVDEARNYVLIGKERHDIGRPNDEGYPIRGIIKDGFLFLQNFKTDRWPAGNPETGYLNTDGSPTKSLILELNRQKADDENYWALNFGKRPEREFYDVRKDPFCLNNLAHDPEYSGYLKELSGMMKTMLTEQKDPRVLGQGDVFDQYSYADEKTKDFYSRYMAGEKMKAGWVNPEDFEEDTIVVTNPEK